MSAAMPDVTCFVDGSANNLLGDGGWGVVLLSGKRRKELSGSLENTNSQRAEVHAAISALGALKRPSKVTIHSDSKYLVRGSVFIGVSAPKSNGDLWEKLESSMEGHDVRFEKVAGHAGVEENERAHELAYAAYRELTEKRDAGEREIVPEWMRDEGEAGGEADIIDFAEARKRIREASAPAPAVDEDPDAPRGEYLVWVKGDEKRKRKRGQLLLSRTEAEATRQYRHFAEINPHLECVLKKLPSGEVLLDLSGKEAAV